MADATIVTKEGITQTGPIFSEKRRRAIEMMNAGTRTMVGAPGTPQNPAAGYQMIKSAVDLDPSMGFAWFQLGNTNADLKLPHGALAAYRRALETPMTGEIGALDQKVKAMCYCNMGHTFYHLGRHDEALAATLQAIETDPSVPYDWLNLSLIKSITGHDAEAVEAALKAYAMEPDNATIECGLGFAYLHDRQYAKGMHHMEARFAYKLPHFLTYPYPKWNGESGTDVFVVADQGLGDSLDFLRFVPQAIARASHITLGIQAELLRLTRDLWAKHPKVTLYPLPNNLPPADHWCAIMSLPRALGLTDEQILATKMPEITTFFPQAQWKMPNRKLHVAVAWGGSPLNDVDKHRSIPLQHFVELARVPDTEFYSLQVGDRAIEVHNFGAAVTLRDIVPFVRDVTDTIGILRHIDLVICCDTALGHIAGVIDKEAWIAVAYNGCDWRFGRHGDKSIWFPNHKIYRQGIDQRWEPVFEQIIADLTDRVAKIEDKKDAA